MRTFACLMIMLFTASIAYADLTPWEDYEPSDAVWTVTTVRVQPNMDDAYLEGLSRTWVTAMKALKKIGQIEDYRIYRSSMPQSGDFNLLLVTKVNSSADLAPSKARYDALIKEMGQKEADEGTQYAQKNYPAMREITGEYRLREITLK